MAFGKDPAEVLMAAFAQALAEAGPDAMAQAIMESLLSKRESYGSRTVLASVLDAAVKELATEVVAEYVKEKVPQIKEQIVAALDTMRIDVRMGDTINVVPTLRQP